MVDGLHQCNVICPTTWNQTCKEPCRALRPNLFFMACVKFLQKCRWGWKKRWETTLGCPSLSFPNLFSLKARSVMTLGVSLGLVGGGGKGLNVVKPPPPSPNVFYCDGSLYSLLFFRYQPVDIIQPTNHVLPASFGDSDWYIVTGISLTSTNEFSRRKPSQHDVQK